MEPRQDASDEEHKDWRLMGLGYLCNDRGGIDACEDPCNRPAGIGANISRCRQIRRTGLWAVDSARDKRLVLHKMDKDGLGQTGRVRLGIRGGKIGGHYGVLHEGEPIRGGLDYGAEGLEYGAEGLDRKAD